MQTYRRRPDRVGIDGDGPATDGPGAGEGNAALAARIEAFTEGSSGIGLPPHLAELAQQSLGFDAGGVRIHPDSGGLAEELGLEAFAVGRDLLFAAGAYRPDDEHGRFVLLHELAHAAQQGDDATTLQAFGDHGAAEADADQAAEAMLSGASYSVGSAPRGVYGYDATARRRADGRRITSDICHENQTLEGAERAGLDAEQAAQVYSGNWQRDFNQVLTPGMGDKGPLVYDLLSIAHTKHFGTPLPGMDEFGTADQVEHIDNPGGMTGGSIFAQATDDGTPMVGDVVTGTQLAGPAGVPLAAIDPRYHRAAEDLGGDVLNPADHIAFQVDESGIPVYIKASRNQLKDGLESAARIGTGGDGRGLRYAGEALHILQDYFAHSNFCPIAMNTLLNDGMVPGVAAGLGVDVGYYKLDTGVHAVGSPNDNLTTAGGREVMATGTFTEGDSLHSLKKKVLLFVDELNPFEDEAEAAGPSPWMIALLTWMERNPEMAGDTSTLGQRVGERLGKLGPVIRASVRSATWCRASAERLEGGFEDAATAVGAGKVRDAYLPAEDHEAQAAAIERRAEDLLGRLEQLTAAMAGGDLDLAELYSMVGGRASPVAALGAAARAIPVIGGDLAPRVEAVAREAWDWLRARLNEAWKRAQHAAIEAIEEAAAKKTGNTDISGQDGTAESMTQPTHTDVAQDFSLPSEAREDHDGHDLHEHDRDERQHRHGGAWLAPLGDRLARDASTGALTLLKRCWDAPDDQLEGAIDTMHRYIDATMAHPLDCRGTWEPLFRAALADEKDPHGLRAELAERTHRPPSVQVDIPHG